MSAGKSIFEDGRERGLARDTTKRGVMAFCGAFSIDAETARNVKLWLDGFDQGMTEEPLRPSVDLNPYGNIPPRDYGRRGRMV